MAPRRAGAPSGAIARRARANHRPRARRKTFEAPAADDEPRPERGSGAEPRDVPCADRGGTRRGACRRTSVRRFEVPGRDRHARQLLHEQCGAEIDEPGRQLPAVSSAIGVRAPGTRARCRAGSRRMRHTRSRCTRASPVRRRRAAPAGRARSAGSRRRARPEQRHGKLTEGDDDAGLDAARGDLVDDLAPGRAHRGPRSIAACFTGDRRPRPNGAVGLGDDEATS